MGDQKHRSGWRKERKRREVVEPRCLHHLLPKLRLLFALRPLLRRCASSDAGEDGDGNGNGDGDDDGDAKKESEGAPFSSSSSFFFVFSFCFVFVSF